MTSLASKQALALAMARHPRLGAASCAAALEADTLALIFGFVQEAHRELVATKRIASIHVRAGDLIDRIEIRYSDGTHLFYGGHGGEWQRPMRLQPGEIITGVGGRNSLASSLQVNSIDFTTSRGVTCRFKGRLNGGAPFTYQIPTGMLDGLQIDGLVCYVATHGTWLRSINGVEVKETPLMSSMARLLIDHSPTEFLPHPNGPFTQRTGALTNGHDIEVRWCTLAQAKARALELPGCAGFTFQSTTPPPDLPIYTPDNRLSRIFFKRRRNGNTDVLWQTYLLTDWTGADPAPTPWP